MDKETRDYLKKEVDRRSRERAETYYLDCDPESLTMHALEMQDLGYPEMAEALIHFRDRVVNPLLAEGWTVARIEEATYRYSIRHKTKPDSNK